MSFDKKQAGSKGEEEAVRYLRSRGYRVLDRNWKNPFGEVDIIASKNEAIIFIEVKTRIVTVDNPLFFGEDSVDHVKQKKLRKLGEYYLKSARFPDDTEWQIDVLAVDIESGGNVVDIRHLEQAVIDE